MPLTLLPDRLLRIRVSFEFKGEPREGECLFYFPKTGARRCNMWPDGSIKYHFLSGKILGEVFWEVRGLLGGIYREENRIPSYRELMAILVIVRKTHGHLSAPFKVAYYSSALLQEACPDGPIDPQEIVEVLDMLQVAPMNRRQVIQEAWPDLYPNYAAEIDNLTSNKDNS